MLTAHAEFCNHSTTMESDTAVASVCFGDEFWHLANLQHNSNMDRGLSGLEEVSRCSRIFTEQNERQTSWKDEEVVENEAVYAILKITKHVFGNSSGRQSRHGITSTPSTSVELWF